MGRRGTAVLVAAATAVLGWGAVGPPAQAAPVPQQEATGDLVGDVLAVERLEVRGEIGDLWQYAGDGRNGLRTAQRIGSGFGDAQVWSAGNWDGVGRSDLMAWFYRQGELRLYPRDEAGAFGRARVIASRYSMRETILPGDFSGDGVPDALGLGNGTGKLYLFPGDGRGGLGTARQIGQGWYGRESLFSPGDWDGDGATDLVSREITSGRLYLNRGDGRGGFTGTAVQIGTGWADMDRLGGAVDLSGDGRPDVVATSPGGLLYLYRGDGSGGFLPGRVLLGNGWYPFQAITASVRAGATRPPS